MTGWIGALRTAAAVGGVRAVFLVAVDDGLLVQDLARDDTDVAAAAALVAALVRRSASLSVDPPGTITLSSSTGTVVAVDAGDELWLAAVAGPGAELGRLRLVLGDLAAGIGR